MQLSRIEAHVNDTKLDLQSELVESNNIIEDFDLELDRQESQKLKSMN